VSDRLAAYLRDSGGDEQDLSLDQQETEIKRWAQENGYVITRFFRDEARPGSSVVGRDAFLRMMDHFRQPETAETGVVIWKYSRFARDFDDSQFYKADIRRRGYKIYSIKDNIPEGPEGRFFEAAIDWMNQRFLSDLSSDVKRGLSHIVETYGAMPGTPPAGFIRVPIEIGKRRDGTPHILHRWAPDEETAPAIRQVFELRAHGKTYKQIMQEAPDIVAKNTLTDLLRNKLYIGILEYGGKEFPEYCEALVDQVTWDAVQKLRRYHERSQHLSSDAGTWNIRRRSSLHVLSGLAFCGRCGSPLFAHPAKQKNGSYYQRYACTRSRRRGDCDARPIPGKVLDQAVIETIEQFILRPDHLEMIHEISMESQAEALQVAAEKAKGYKRQQGKLRGQIGKITAAIAVAGHSRALIAKLQQLEMQDAELVAQIEELSLAPLIAPIGHDELVTFAHQAAQLLRSSEPETVRDVLRGIITRVVAERDGANVLGMVYYGTPKKKVRGSDLTVSTSDVPLGAPTYRHSFSAMVRHKTR